MQGDCSVCRHHDKGRLFWHCKIAGRSRRKDKLPAWTALNPDKDCTWFKRKGKR